VLEYWSTGVLGYWSIGVLENWSIGVLECRGIGELEYWNNGVLGYLKEISNLQPFLQHFIAPFLQYSDIDNNLKLHDG